MLPYNVKRHLFALGSMALGSLLVFVMVVIMNAFSEPPSKTGLEQVTSFEVDRKKPPPKKREEQAQKRERKKVQASVARAPTPELSSSISGASFGLPAFEADLSSLATDSVLGDTNKDMVMTEDAVDQPAQATSRAAAAYPPQARQRGVEGYVTLNIMVGTDGAVKKVQVLGADPPGVFEDAARECVRQWDFRPGQYQGSPVSMWVKQTIRFKLK